MVFKRLYREAKKGLTDIVLLGCLAICSLGFLGGCIDHGGKGDDRGTTGNNTPAWQGGPGPSPR